MNSELIERRSALLQEIADASLVVLGAGRAPVKSADELYPFAVSRNFFYLIGLEREEVIYLAMKCRDQVQERLFIPRPDPTKEKWTGYQLRVDEAKKVSGLEQVFYTDEFLAQMDRLLVYGDCQNLYMDFAASGTGANPSLLQQFEDKLHSQYGYLHLANIHPYISSMRRIKSASEITKIREAIAVTAAGLQQLWRNAKPGMTEYQLEAHFNFPLKMAGIKDFAFPTIIASGPNATTLHYVENDRTIQEGELVLLDLGASFGHYSADISRTFPITGKFTERQRDLYELVLLAQGEVFAAVKPGIPIAQLNEIAKSVLAKGLERLGLIANESELERYYYHRVSHFLGLDTHDVGIFEGELKPGMVITIEPGLYIAEENIGIRIEDDVLVTETGAENLSAAIPKTVADIEAILQAQK